MDSSYTCCDMGLFDFFRRSSRSRSKTTANDTVTTTTTTSSTFTSATASNVSDASMVSVESVSMSSSSVSKSSSSAAYSLRHSMPEAPQLKESATSLDSTATTASVESNNDENDQDENDALPDEPRAMINNYEIVRELGRGATAVVQLGKLKDGDQLVALKVFKTSLLKKMREVKRVGRRMVVSTALDKVQVEIAIMKKLQHRNLLNLLGVFDDDSETLVLMLEYAKHGQIMQWDANDKTYRVNPKAVPDSTSGVFDEDSLRVCVRQLLLGLEYLHENNICHRDLKPENILLGDDGVYKIADFGVAHLFDEEKKPENETAPLPEKSNQIGQPPASAEGKKKGIVSSTAGTYAFMGPETLKGKEYSAYDADVWALGITVYALVFGKIPYYHQDVMELFEMIENQPLDLGDSEDNNNNNSGSSISEGLTSLLRGMLEKNPETRWSLKQCKQHEWVLQGLDDKAKREFLDVQHEQVTVDQDEVMRAVTRVTSMNVLMRVQLGASKWKRKAMKSLEIKKRASLSAPPTIDEDSASERLSVASSYSERSSFDVRGLPATTTTAKAPAATGEDNQLEL